MTNPTKRLLEAGICVLPKSFDEDSVAEMRAIIISNLAKMGSTRPNAASRHIAGFHRYPALEGLHHMITSNEGLRAALTNVYAPAEFITIGLSDIAVNRSQPWHTDLLRGPYSHFLTHEVCWGVAGVSCLKALLYLQDSESLRVLLGSHLTPVSLSDDSACTPLDADAVTQIRVQAGDVLLMDVRLVHRGSTEDELTASSLTDAPKILVSTVFGAQGASITRAMQLGNACRTADWDERHLPPTSYCSMSQRDGQR